MEYPGVLEMVRVWWPVVATVLNMLLAAVIIILMRTFVTKDDHAESERILHVRVTKTKEAADARIAGTETKIAVLGKAIENLPTHKDLANLSAAVKGLEAQTSALGTLIKGMSEQVSLLVENELKGGK